MRPTPTRTSAGTPTRRATAPPRPGCRGSTSGGYPLRAADGVPVDDLGRPVNAKGQPIDAHGRLLTDADGVPLAPAPRTQTCESAGKDYGIKLALDGSWYRCCGGKVRRIRDCCGEHERADQRRRGARGLLLPGPPRLLRDVLRDVDAVLSGLAVAGAITALLAGIAGAWSPCGFSMVDTIGTALGDARRGVTAGGERDVRRWARSPAVSSTFGGLSLAGAALGSGSAGLRDAIAGALALAAAFADWRGWRIAPQIRRQVPERWRWIMPLPLASSLYGLLLGLGFTTFVLSFAVWALAGISVAAGSPALGPRRRAGVRSRARAAGAVDRPAARHSRRRPRARIARADAAHVARHAPAGRARPRRLRGAARRAGRGGRSDSRLDRPVGRPHAARVAARRRARRPRHPHGAGFDPQAASRRWAGATWRGSGATRS